MRTYTPLIALAAVALLLMGASSCTSNNSNSGTVYTGGTNGLLFSFEDQAPPNLIYDNGQSPFSIIVNVENDGEFDTQNVKFWITGINSNDFPGLPTNYTYDQTIQGITKLQDQTIPGSTVPVPIGPSNICYVKSLKGGGELSFNLNVNACYGYATLSTSTVCLQSNYLNGDNSVCDPASSSQISVSGAPVTITKFQQQAVGQHQLQLRWTYSIKNNVEIWAPYPGQDCHPNDTSQRILEQNWMYVQIDDNQGSGGTINCVNLMPANKVQHPYGVLYDGKTMLQYPQQYLTGNAILVSGVADTTDGYIKLGPDGTATLTCTLDVPSNTQDSTGTVDMVATYDVQDMVSKQFSVTHTDGGSAASQCAQNVYTGGAYPTYNNQGGSIQTQPSACQTAYNNCYYSPNLGSTAVANACSYYTTNCGGAAPGTGQGGAGAAQGGAPPAGACTCLNSAVSGDACTSGYSAQCLSSDTCNCVAQGQLS